MSSATSTGWKVHDDNNAFTTIGVKKAPEVRKQPRQRKTAKKIVKPSLKKKPEAVRRSPAATAAGLRSGIIWTTTEKLFRVLFPGQLGFDLNGMRWKFFGSTRTQEMFEREAVAAGVLLRKTYHEIDRKLDFGKALRVFAGNTAGSGSKNPGVGKIFMWLLNRKDADVADDAFEHLWRGSFAQHDITNFIHTDGTVYSGERFADVLIEYDRIAHDLFHSDFKVVQAFFEQNVSTEFWLPILQEHWRERYNIDAVKIVYLSGGLLLEEEHAASLGAEDARELREMLDANILRVISLYGRDSVEFQAAYWSNPNASIWLPLVLRAAESDNISASVLEYLISVMDAGGALDEPTRDTLRAVLEFAELNRDLANSDITPTAGIAFPRPQ